MKNTITALTLKEIGAIHGGLIKEAAQISGTVGAILILWGIVEVFKSSKSFSKHLAQTQLINEKKAPNINM